MGLRWNVSREHWLENQDILNDVSIRASYGFQGNVAENVGPELSLIHILARFRGIPDMREMMCWMRF